MSDECRGGPRVQYTRTYRVIPQDAPLIRAQQVFAKAWTGRNTVGFSYDDAGIGDLDSRTAVLYDIPEGTQQSYSAWYDNYYPGVQVEFASNILPWPVGNGREHRYSVIPGGLFNAARSYGNHEGVDLLAYAGDPILAVRSGLVVWASNKRRSNPVQNSDYGWHVIVDHQDGYVTWYAHLQNLSVSRNQQVQAGQQVGPAGTSGNSTGVHLHFNVQCIGCGLSGYIIPDVVNPAPLLGLTNGG